MAVTNAISGTVTHGGIPHREIVKLPSNTRGMARRFPYRKRHSVFVCRRGNSAGQADSGVRAAGVHSVLQPYHASSSSPELADKNVTGEDPAGSRSLKH
jgi:hypothetical protein